MQIKDVLGAINRFGISPEDDFLTKNRKRFAMYGGLAMSFGALMWGIICLYFGMYEKSIIPFFFILLSLFNLLYFRKINKFESAVLSQTFFALVLPFGFQWHLGGFSASGCVMLWGLVSLAVSLSFNDLRLSSIWLIVYLVLTVVSGFLDSYVVRNADPGLTHQSELFLLMLNILLVSVFVSILIMFFVSENKKSYQALERSKMQLIQSERLAALGTLSAGIAHEINTPLATIKAVAEEETIYGRDIFKRFFKIIHAVNNDQLEQIGQLILEHTVKKDFLSTPEERRRISELTVELEKLGMSNPRNYASKLVRSDFFSVPDVLKSLPNGLVTDLIDLLYIVFQREKNFGMMLSATEKASRIVRALKVYIHNPSESSVENIDLYDSISAVLFIYSSLMKEEVEVKLDVPELPKVSGYKDQLSLVWTNLIMNALQAMEFKGTIEIKAAKLDKFIRVSIRDTGPGIDPSVQDMILKDIVTTKSSGEGTGIGLSLVKKMIESQLGRIWFESEPGKGTTFFVELPVSSEK